MHRLRASWARAQSPTAGVIVTALGAATLVGIMAPWRDRISLLNEGLVLLLWTLVISALYGWRIGVFAAIVTNMALNFFFIEPLHTLTVGAAENVVGLGVFLMVSVVGGSLLTAARSAARDAQLRQAETQVLLRMSRAMIGQANAADALRALCRELIAAFDAPGAAVLTRHDGTWNVLASAGGELAARHPDGRERAMAEQSVTAGVLRVGHTGLARSRRVRIVGSSGAPRFEQPSTGTIVSPLLVGDRVLGVLRLDGPIGATPFRGNPEHLLEAFAGEAALAVQRVELTQAASHADALRQADELKTALLTSISHDLKTPLAGIKASVSSLLDANVQWSPADRRSFLETIDSQVDRLDRVISDILDLNRLESGAISSVPAAVEVRTLLHAARDASRLTTSGREVSVTAPRGMCVWADEALVQQALVNLIENAAKYAPPNSAIRLSATSGSGGVEIAVEDDGPGIAPAALPHVFDRFYRGPEQSRRVKGSGLGLAIVKGFVELHGGRVRVDPHAAGARFVITLPAADSTVPA
jgi:two-component system sensor histidine kinase KdpD